MAPTGAVVNHSGACATPADATMRAIGFQPFDFAWSSEVTTSAAAPSLILEELAAVTLPSFWNAGFNVGILSSGAANGSSSASTFTGAPFFWGTSTGAISALKKQAFAAFWARLYDSSAKASCSSLVKWYFETHSSA